MVPAMRLWRSLTNRQLLELPPVDELSPNLPEPRHRFSSTAIGSDYQTWQALVAGTAGAGRVTRVQAAAVPAVKRARDLIAGTIATLPLHAVNTQGTQVDHALLQQPEALQGLVRSVTIARTVEDLLYEGASLWTVVLRTSQGFPQVVERLEWGKWSQDEAGTIWINGREAQPADTILFTSPADPLLVVGAPAIRNLITLEQTAALYAATPEPTSYFTPSETGYDPQDDSDIEALLADWQAARRNRAVAWVPSAVDLKSVTRQTAEEMQLTAAREFSVLEVARLTGIDGDWLSVNTTSRTYLNSQDSRKSFVDYVLSPYLRAVEERLSLGDVTPRGQKVLFSLDGFMRADVQTRYNSYTQALAGGWLTLNEIRALEDRPPLDTTGGATDA
jgi:hypothetical protein